jgi:hypothetical protein
MHWWGSLSGRSVSGASPMCNLMRQGLVELRGPAARTIVSDATLRAGQRLNVEKRPMFAVSGRWRIDS